ncbi:hypothetical protein GQ53DRAFT_200814 [Thozetella sp. PMI_491]|nr:hypothetical protein GQ53DRAFT_200814 [Thozetella sp. PMI_491]
MKIAIAGPSGRGGSICPGPAAAFRSGGTLGAAALLSCSGRKGVGQLLRNGGWVEAPGAEDHRATSTHPRRQSTMGHETSCIAMHGNHYGRRMVTGGPRKHEG